MNPISSLRSSYRIASLDRKIRIADGSCSDGDRRIRVSRRVTARDSVTPAIPEYDLSC